MTRQYYRKPHRIKRKKSVFKNKFFWLAVLILAFAGGILYFLIFSSFFETKEIKISGNEKVQEDDIRNLIENRVWADFRFFKNKNVILANLSEINKAILETFPEIAKVSSGKNLPDTLTFEVEERKPAAIFEQNGNLFFIDKEGVAFEGTYEQSDLFPTIRNLLLKEDLKLGEAVAEKNVVSGIFNLASKMAEDLKIPLKELTVVSEERLNVKTAEGWDVYFNLKGDLDWQFTKLKTVVEKRIPPEKRGNVNYVDLRFERIYIYPETYNQ